MTEQYRNNRIEADHARLKARLRPMRGLTRFRSAEVIAAGHAVVQNLRRAHYELATDASPPLRVATAFSTCWPRPRLDPLLDTPADPLTLRQVLAALA